MKKIKLGLNIIISFLLIFSIIGQIMCNLVNKKVLSKKYIISEMEKENFYKEVSDEIQSGFENYIYQSGLPEDILDDIFTEDDVKNDVGEILEYLYSSTEYKLSDDLVRQKLDSKINKYLEEQKVTLNEEGRKNVNQFEDLIVKEYTSKIDLGSTVLGMGNSFIGNINKYYNRYADMCLLLNILLIISLILLNLKTLFNILYCLGISVLSVGIIFRIGLIYISKNISIDNIVVLSNSISSLLHEIINEIIYTIGSYSNFFIFCGIFAIIVTAIISNKDVSDDTEMIDRKLIRSNRKYKSK